MSLEDAVQLKHKEEKDRIKKHMGVICEVPYSDGTHWIQGLARKKVGKKYLKK